MSILEQYLLIFLAGGIIIGGILLRIVRGVLFMTSRFIGGAYPVHTPIATANNQPYSNSDNSIFNWLLLIIICLIGYVLLSSDARTTNFKLKEIPRTNSKAMHKEAYSRINVAPSMGTDNTYPSSKKKIVAKVSHSNKTSRKAMANRPAISSSSETFFIQLRASSSLEKLQRRRKRYESIYTTYLGFRAEQYPFKLLLGPFDSKKAIADFQATYPKFRNGWVRSIDEFDEIR